MPPNLLSPNYSCISSGAATCNNSSCSRCSSNCSSSPNSSSSPFLTLIHPPQLKDPYESDLYAPFASAQLSYLQPCAPRVAYPQPLQTPTHYLPVPPTHRPGNPKRKPNWAEFYKNGYPSEVIVISDDEEEAIRPKKRKISASPLPARKRQLVEYVPPSGPVLKARDVPVPVVHDAPGSAPTCDDADGHLVIKNTTTLANGRFRVCKVLGQGTFGKVVSAFDTKTKKLCAVKIIRAVPKYRDASKIELRVLSTLAAYDRDNRNRCIHLRECFDYKNHICIVTDLLGMSIYDFLKSNHYIAFPARHVHSFARQIFSSVAYLHDLGLVHTDLKPENILLRHSTAQPAPLRNHPKYTTTQVLTDTHIHLIDFGSAIFDNEYHNTVVSTRHYRAPEIILGTGWSFSCDVWSIGCILVEFCTGEALFQTHDNLEHLALMQKVVGRPVDACMLRAARLSATGADMVAPCGTRIAYPARGTKKASEKHVRNTRPLSSILRAAMATMHDGAEPPSDEAAFWTGFMDLLSRIFVYDPRQRITAREALDHPWMKMVM